MSQYIHREVPCRCDGSLNFHVMTFHVMTKAYRLANDYVASVE